MSEYGDKINEIAERAFSEYSEAEQAYKAAQDAFKNDSASLDAEKRNNAGKNLFKAKEEYRHACERFQNHDKEFRELRKDLEKHVTDAYAVDPAEIDHDVITLMDSGILQPSDYEKLIEAAQNDENATMCRLIAKRCNDESKKYSDNDVRSATYRRLATIAAPDKGSTTLKNFDDVAMVFDRTAKNPGMIKHWHDLVDDVVNNL